MADILKTLVAFIASLLAMFGNGVTVASITDGDTIKLSTGETVRLSGIDAPEASECYSSESAQLVSELVLGKKVTLQKASPEKDWYGRTLGYLFVGGRTVNEELVRAGAARFYYFPKEGDKENEEEIRLIAAEEEARVAKVGLWGSCFDKALGSCSVKGNLGTNDKRRYLLPEDRHYAVTVINRDKGDLWLCSEAEAVARGFVRGDRY